MNILNRNFQKFKNLSHSLKYRSSYSQLSIKKNQGVSKIWAFFLSGMAFTNAFNFYNFRARCQDAESAGKTTEEPSREEKIAGLRRMFTYEIGVPEDFPEGQLKEITLMHEGKEFKCVVARVDGLLFAVSPYCTYDDKTPLKDGVLFGNKLYSPNYGCAYNIKTGTVEYGPAIDNLAMFYVREKNGKVQIAVPKHPPKKIRPMAAFRDYNDLRKIIIIGNGAAAIGCIEGLRNMGYTGELKLISKDPHLPYDKTKLSKQFKDLNYEDLIIRPESYFDDHGIEFLLGREAINIDHKHVAPCVELEDGLRLEYDAVLVATGTYPEHRKFEGADDKVNITYLNDIYDHKKIRGYLDKKIKNVTIVGTTFTSLETAATIRKEYPDITVHVIDENQNLSLDQKLGRDVADVILNMHKKNGVRFSFSTAIKEFKGTNDEVKEIYLQDGKKIKTDLIILFPNNKLANSEFVANGNNLDNIEYEFDGRIRVDENQRSGIKRIFSAGEASAGRHPLTLDRMPCDNWYTSFHGGMNAAWNMLALDIPNAVNPFFWTKQYDQLYTYTGYTSDFEEYHIEGSLEKNDFIVYYSVMDHIVAAFGSPNRNKDMIVLNEGFRLHVMPLLSQLKLGVKITDIEDQIRESKRSGCFKDLIFEVKDRHKLGDVLWRPRERVNEYYNFWVEGMTPTNEIEKEDG